MFKLMDKEIITIYRLKSFLMWTYENILYCVVRFTKRVIVYCRPNLTGMRSATQIHVRAWANVIDRKMIYNHTVLRLSIFPVASTCRLVTDIQVNVYIGNILLWLSFQN